MSFFGITDIVAYLVGTIAIVIIPGPNSLYCLYIAGNKGKTAAYHAVAGIMLADVLLMLIAVLSSASILHLPSQVSITVKLLGGLYLAYIGLDLVLQAYHNSCTYNHKGKKQAIAYSQTIENNLSSHRTIFMKALIIGLSNPKAILFFMAFFVQFVDANYTHPMISFLLLGTLLFFISLAFLILLVIMGQNLLNFLARYRYLAVAGLASVGLIFIGFSLSLFTAI